MHHFLSGLTEVFLHVRCVPHHNSQRCFWASVCEFGGIGPTMMSLMCRQITAMMQIPRISKNAQADVPHPGGEESRSTDHGEGFAKPGGQGIHGFLLFLRVWRTGIWSYREPQDEFAKMIRNKTPLEIAVGQKSSFLGQTLGKLWGRLRSFSDFQACPNCDRFPKQMLHLLTLLGSVGPTVKTKLYKTKLITERC